MGILRAGIAAGLLGFLLVFFLPLIPFTKVVHFSCVFSCPPIPAGGAYSGYNSIGYLLTGWGAVYSGWQGGYLLPAISYAFGDGPTTLTAFGALIEVVLPVSVGIAGLLASEIVDFSRASRISFAVFGAFVFGFWILGLASMKPMNPIFILEGVWLIPIGGLMTAYALRKWIYRLDQTVAQL